MLTKDSSLYLAESLGSLQSFSEVIIVDNGSTDNTLEIAGGFKNVIIHQHPFIGFGPLKNVALGFTSHDWVLSVDSDEVLSEALVEEILGLRLASEKKVYAILRDNYYKSRCVKCCGWQNDYVLRLFNKNETSFHEMQVHESLKIDSMKTVKLTNSMKHFTYGSVEQLLNKLQSYSTLYAKQHRQKRAASPTKAFFRAAFTFFKNYFVQKGFLNGYEGLLISVYNANGTFFKYMKLYEENQTK